MSEWRNWQTRKTKDLVPVRVWGFKSPLRHQILVVNFETRTLCGGSGLVFFWLILRREPADRLDLRRNRSLRAWTGCRGLKVWAAPTLWPTFSVGLGAAAIARSTSHTTLCRADKGWRSYIYTLPVRTRV